MRKKWLACIAAAVLLLMLASCGSPDEVQPEEQVEYEIAMVTESGLIMNGGYSQVAWDTISSFGTDKGISHRYYKATEATEAAYAQAIDEAAAGGAKIIIADGYLFSQVVYEKQDQYEDIKFALIDAEPMDAESGEVKIGDNTVEITFASEQAGYLAGYGAVKDGMTQLGFMGDAKKALVMDYGYGFLQGAEKACQENGSRVQVKYHYAAGDEDSAALNSRADSWYSAGTEVIFACGNSVELPIIESAELQSKKVIGYETDKSSLSDTVVTSAAKNISAALEAVLERYDDDEFPGGTTVAYDAANDGVWLELDNGKLTNLDKSDYDDIVKSIKDGDIKVKRYNSGDISSLGLTHIDVTEE